MIFSDFRGGSKSEKIVSDFGGGSKSEKILSDFGGFKIPKNVNGFQTEGVKNNQISKWDFEGGGKISYFTESIFEAVEKYGESAISSSSTFFRLR